MKKGLNVGTNVYKSCSIDISAYLTGNVSTTLFYDLFAVKSSGSYYPIPVRIQNYLNSGSSVNAASDGTVVSSNQLFRRFFIYDVSSGVQSGSLTAIRMPSSIKLW